MKTSFRARIVCLSGVLVTSLILGGLSASRAAAVSTNLISNPVVCQPSYVNGLANGDFEDSCQSANGLPAGWDPVQYGNSSASVATSSNAYGGAKAVSISNFADGVEAGLASAIVAPLPGQRYSLGFWQAGNTYMYAYLTFGLKDGSRQYQGLMSVSSSADNWSQYTDSFVTPANMKSLQITIATSGAGTVTVDDVVLTTQLNLIPATFNAGVVSLTFDDGVAGTYTNGFSKLKTYGYKGTFYLNGSSLDTPNFMTSKQVQALVVNGQEIASHLYHHVDMVQLDAATLRTELTTNKQALQDMVGSQYPVNDFASPYGSFTSGTVNTVMQYAQSHRDTDGVFNTKANFDPRQVHAKLITPGTTAATLRGWVRQAKVSHSWLVLVYHNITSSTSVVSSGEAGYTITSTLFAQHLATIRQSGIAVMPVATALVNLRTQL